MTKIQRREPDRQNRGRKAWKIDAKSQAEPGDPRVDLSVGCWLLQCPGAHPLWEFYAIFAVKLNDAPGVKPAYKQYPSAECEIVFAALSPGYEPDPEKLVIKPLEPIDLAYQCHGVTDAEVSEILSLIIDRIMTSPITPDSDYRSYWMMTLDMTVSHFTNGRCGPRSRS